MDAARDRRLRGPAPAAEAAGLPHAGLGRRGRGRGAGRLAALDAGRATTSPIPPPGWCARPRRLCIDRLRAAKARARGLPRPLAAGAADRAADRRIRWSGPRTSRWPSCWPWSGCRRWSGRCSCCTTCSTRTMPRSPRPWAAPSRPCASSPAAPASTSARPARASPSARRRPRAWPRPSWPPPPSGDMAGALGPAGRGRRAGHRRRRQAQGGAARPGRARRHRAAVRGPGLARRRAWRTCDVRAARINGYPGLVLTCRDGPETLAFQPGEDGLIAADLHGPQPGQAGPRRATPLRGEAQPPLGSSSPSCPGHGDISSDQGLIGLSSGRRLDPGRGSSRAAVARPAARGGQQRGRHHHEEDHQPEELAVRPALAAPAPRPASGRPAACSTPKYSRAPMAASVTRRAPARRSHMIMRPSPKSRTPTGGSNIGPAQARRQLLWGRTTRRRCGLPRRLAREPRAARMIPWCASTNASSTRSSRAFARPT